MINIPTPEEWMKIYLKIYDDNGDIPLEELESFSTKDVCEIMKAYNEHIIAHKILKLEKEKVNGEKSLGMRQGWNMALRKAIETLKK